jgi:heme exporter protein D
MKVSLAVDSQGSISVGYNITISRPSGADTSNEQPSVPGNKPSAHFPWIAIGITIFILIALAIIVVRKRKKTVKLVNPEPQIAPNVNDNEQIHEDIAVA